ncbi:hypothetical protein T05_2617 [Trichinella murrelli]|uniref:Uncharacterized protein n=1 Tax=Trichinella murrelli TaxID=144512 RepID=A0A0V0T8T0_9BILA|nr:hypothetical protein T05_2617 [Trichinella murrelli]
MIVGERCAANEEWHTEEKKIKEDILKTMKLSTLDIAKSYLLQRAYILTSLDQRTELTNERN